ncbi:MAG: voltage-gated chloride channel protein [Allobaculum sp.]|nr:voltage-gated chloride channel protein [Allobaculum sp.]
MKTKSSIVKFLTDLVLLFAIGLLVGGVVGLFEAIFVQGLNFVVNLRQMHGNCLWLLGLPFAGLVIVWLFNTFSKYSKEGMAIIFKINQGTAERIPRALMPLMIVSTWISQLFGASVGKEGVGLQIGAAISNVLSEYVPYLQNKKTIIMVTGMAAGFAGVFGTPFTAIVFAMEILVSGLLEYRALTSSISAALASSWVVHELGLHKEAIPLNYTFEFHLATHGWKLLILGIIFGVAGALFAVFLHKSHAFFEKKFENPYKRIFYCAIPLALLLWVCMDGRYCGSGMNLIEAAGHGEEIYVWDFALKLLLSIFSLSIGFVGGDVTPLFAVGATLGAVLGPLFGLPAPFGAALGYAATFGAGTNTWVSPLVIGMEIFGYAYFPFFFITCSFAFLVNGNQSIYGLQRKLISVFNLKDLDWNHSSLDLTIAPEEKSDEPKILNS